MAAALLCITDFSTANDSDAARQVIARAILTEDADEQVALVRTLGIEIEPRFVELLKLWKEGEVYLYEVPPGTAESAPDMNLVPVTLGQFVVTENKYEAIRVDTGKQLRVGDGNAAVRIGENEFPAAETTSALRMVMKELTERAALSLPDREARRKAIEQIGLGQNADHLPLLRARATSEENRRVREAIREAIALIELKSSDASTQIAACRTLGEMGSISSRDALKALVQERRADEGLPAGVTSHASTATIASTDRVLDAASSAIDAIERHMRWVNFYGTLFRGLSLGSVLLTVALGLAITFGLMGVINMAHGELIAVGAYTTYVVQNIFGQGLALSPFGFRIALPGLNTSGALYDNYFLFAIPLSFLAAGLVGIVLERGVIRFLYRRPLESLLATWGVSLILQQLFRLTFGANNVQVYSPSWLSGNWTVFDVMFGWNRLFVITFAALILLATVLILSRTAIGLLVRAVMQNRDMAACMGVRTERVNMITFAFGSGLAGLAGAFLSQLGNVGPSLGQSYIVESFMTVVVGGVGHVWGAVFSALGIGIFDQTLQQLLLNPVLGKILVLGLIILLLQWRPAGLFTSSSRSLEG